MAVGPDEDVVADFQRVEGLLSSSRAHGRADDAVCADNGAAGKELLVFGVRGRKVLVRDLPADGDGGGCGPFADVDTTFSGAFRLSL